jgi:phenylacetate-CoA ligase
VNWPTKWRRRAQLAAYGKLSAERRQWIGEKRALQNFRRAARLSAAYRRLLAEAGIDPAQVRSIADFRRLPLVLSKDNTFQRFTLEELCLPGALDNLAGILTSSGHSGRFAFGLSTHRQARRAADFIDLGLEQAFGVDRRRSLLINCLPMGVSFPSRAATVAEVSVREDMALAIAEKFRSLYEQIILVGDPLFLKRLCDFAEERGIDWSDTRLHLIIGEEVFGEAYRDYLAAHFAIDPDQPETGLIGSSMGVGELGLNLFFETPQTIALRRRAWRDPAAFEALFGFAPMPGRPLPMLFSYDPTSVFAEVLAADDTGYGSLTLTVSSRGAPLLLPRYQTGDRARLLDGAAADGLPLIALVGRESERDAQGWHVSAIKDALYCDRDAARGLSGAFRVETVDGQTTVHIQMARGGPPDGSAVKHALSRHLPGLRLRLWPYSDFPYGLSLDYERKFSYAGT